MPGAKVWQLKRDHQTLARDKGKFRSFCTFKTYCIRQWGDETWTCYHTNCGLKTSPWLKTGHNKHSLNLLFAPYLLVWVAAFLLGPTCFISVNSGTNYRWPPAFRVMSSSFPSLMLAYCCAALTFSDPVDCLVAPGSISKWGGPCSTDSPLYSLCFTPALVWHHLMPYVQHILFHHSFPGHRER